MVIVKASEQSEAGDMPSEKLLTEMGKPFAETKLDGGRVGEVVEAALGDDPLLSVADGVIVGEPPPRGTRSPPAASR
jgi:hypothetical protein